MRLLLAFDKFKDTLSALHACELAAQALREKHPDWTLDLCPLADGGEGFAEILTQAANGERVRRRVTGPRGEAVEAAMGLVSGSAIPRQALDLLDLPKIAEPSSRIAVIEMAAASGLALLPVEARDPWQTTSLGTGELIRAAMEENAIAILLGVGGSATNDLGLGALAALGLEFRRADGSLLLSPVPATWSALARIEGRIVPPPPIRIACDVTNPLLGPRGAAVVYGPQKGLRAEDRPRLEEWSERAARLLCAACGKSPALMETPGAGAAGGISFGLMAAADARLLSGFDVVSAWLDLDRRVAAADVVVTGEGRFDESSLSGKGPGAVALRARALGKAVHVFAGQVAVAAPERLALHAITPTGTPTDRALREAPVNLIASILNVF